MLVRPLQVQLVRQVALPRQEERAVRPVPRLREPVPRAVGEVVLPLRVQVQREGEAAGQVPRQLAVRAELRVLPAEPQQELEEAGAAERRPPEREELEAR